MEGPCIFEKRYGIPRSLRGLRPQQLRKTDGFVINEIDWSVSGDQKMQACIPLEHWAMLFESEEARGMCKLIKHTSARKWERSTERGFPWCAYSRIVQSALQPTYMTSYMSYGDFLVVSAPAIRGASRK